MKAERISRLTHFKENIMSQTTREQATAALVHVQTTYGQFGYEAGSRTEEFLISDLMKEHDTLEDAQDTADDFRNTLGSIMGGGSTSAYVTRKVYTDLGRIEETRDNWI
jgi:hypothetical protein